MKAVVQRVLEASVRVDGSVVGAIGRGWLVLLGVARGDAPVDAIKLAKKLVLLRAFEDEAGKMNLNVTQVGGSVLVVSQFTLLGDCSGGNRPSFTDAAPPQEADELYQLFSRTVEEQGLPVARGVFRADMKVALVNDGPVTFILDTRKDI